MSRNERRVERLLEASERLLARYETGRWSDDEPDWEDLRGAIEEFDEGDEEWQ